jgi:murein DD-endopeptidase MepM/ murein hydrolase activator NlpD
MIHDASIALLEAANNSDPAPTGPSALATSEGAALVPNQGPDGVPSGDSIYTPATAQISTYIVKDGDTLSQIAQSYGVTINTIVWANNLGSTKAIHPGETLVILPVSGIEHTVVKGDTLGSLAKKFGGSASDIADFNGLTSDAPLVAGSVVIIPGGEITAITPATSGTGAKPGRRVGQKNPYRGGSGPEIDGYYVNPVPGALLTQGLHGENAVDLAIARGTPVHAAAAGTVIIAVGGGGWHGGYGNYVVIAHANGTQTLYSHESRVIVQPGQSVVQGEIIGYVGMTGDATGPHVHFEVRGALQPFADCPVGSVCEPK